MKLKQAYDTIKALQRVAKKGYVKGDIAKAILKWEPIDEETLYNQKPKSIQLHPGTVLDQNTLGDAKVIRKAIDDSIRRAEKEAEEGEKNATETS